MKKLLRALVIIMILLSFSIAPAFAYETFLNVDISSYDAFKNATNGKAYDMEYQLSGRFKNPFGTGFFDEAGKSSIEILRKERRMKDEESH